MSRRVMRPQVHARTHASKMLGWSLEGKQVHTHSHARTHTNTHTLAHAHTHHQHPHQCTRTPRVRALGRRAPGSRWSRWSPDKIPTCAPPSRPGHPPSASTLTRKKGTRIQGDSMGSLTEPMSMWRASSSGKPSGPQLMCLTSRSLIQGMARGPNWRIRPREMVTAGGSGGEVGERWGRGG